ncbi:hypothetical protein PP175_28480 (plasmid) [Aneurinibacillus sp. Ricciae_BoGa-3]|uniref:hypothetical protein n=1 Tax=Aneurinibacillus sp. Ricciae_BoGa-3 TaxID=3022697 RepID=UPI002341183F|nr:hypothetical protein [Aneurinibacillus sp. Ricciae_BoGa-3]WCK57128.1 hypothetical protein PP175_28480 [Aneurinibacillus sp. Ricciae_BoGa-3]
MAKQIVNRCPTTEDDVFIREVNTEATSFRVYNDEAINIQVATDTNAMRVEIKEPHHNPIIYVSDDGKFIRTHGESHYFLTHAKKN